MACWTQSAPRRLSLSRQILPRSSGPCSLHQQESLKVTTLLPFGCIIGQRDSKFLLPGTLPTRHDGKHDKKQRKKSCTVPAICHLHNRRGDGSCNVVGNCWNCQRATPGDLRFGGGGRGRMAKASQSTAFRYRLSQSTDRWNRPCARIQHPELVASDAWP